MLALKVSVLVVNEMLKYLLPNLSFLCCLSTYGPGLPQVVQKEVLKSVLWSHCPVEFHASPDLNLILWRTIRQGFSSCCILTCFLWYIYCCGDFLFSPAAARISKTKKYTSFCLLDVAHCSPSSYWPGVLAPVKKRHIPILILLTHTQTHNHRKQIVLFHSISHRLLTKWVPFVLIICLKLL